MPGGTVRVSSKARKALRELSRKSGESMQAIIDEAIEAYRRKRFFEEFDAAVRKLQEDPKAWQEELEERKLWEATLMDGLEDD